MLPSLLHMGFDNHYNYVDEHDYNQRMQMLTENTELSDGKISELVDAFINTLSIMLKTQLQAA